MLYAYVYDYVYIDMFVFLYIQLGSKRGDLFAGPSLFASKFFIVNCLVASLYRRSHICVICTIADSPFSLCKNADLLNGVFCCWVIVVAVLLLQLRGNLFSFFCILYACLLYLGQR